MISNTLQSITENIQERFKNPFLGTYCTVWIVRNWELVFTVFNFDSKMQLTDKLNLIHSYCGKFDFIWDLSKNVFFTFLVLIITYLLLNISRFIVNISEKRLTPWIYKISDSKSIVLKSEFDAIKNQRNELQIKLENEREIKLRLEQQIGQLESQLIERDKVVYGEPDSAIDAYDSTNILFNKLKEKNLVEEFKKTAISINKNEFIRNDYEPKEYFLELGLISFKSSHFQQASKTYTITEDGEAVLKKLRLEQ